jgi:CBS domain-containing protein
MMIREPICISPESTISEARQIMLDAKIGCLPVTRDRKLIGLLTKQDMLRLEEKSRQDSSSHLQRHSELTNKVQN